VEGVAVELEDAYAGLGSEWRGENRGRFLEMMVADGCFLLEVIREREKGYPSPKLSSPEGFFLLLRTNLLTGHANTFFYVKIDNKLKTYLNATVLHKYFHSSRLQSSVFLLLH
jgi:hypothetical protein